MVKEKLKNQDLRDKFEKLGLSYNDLTELDINKLIYFLELELIHYGVDNLKMKLSNIRKKDNKRIKGKLAHLFLEVDAYYFKRREAISFNNGGFIGFGGWADSKNVQPFLKSFDLWCDYLIFKDENS